MKLTYKLKTEQNLSLRHREGGAPGRLSVSDRNPRVRDLQQRHGLDALV